MSSRRIDCVFAERGRLCQQRQRISAAAARPARAPCLHGPRRANRCPSVPCGAQARPPAPPQCATLSGVRAKARSTPRPTSPTLLCLRTRREGWRARREFLGRVSQRPHRSGQSCSPCVAGRRARCIRRHTWDQPACFARSRFASFAVSFPPPADNHCIAECHIDRAAGYGARVDAHADAHQRDEFKSPRPPPPSTP